MISSHEADEEVASVLAKQQEVRNNNLRSWIDDMKSLLAKNGYPQGLYRAKRIYFRLQSIPYAIVGGILLRRDFN